MVPRVGLPESRETPYHQAQGTVGTPAHPGLLNPKGNAAKIKTGPRAAAGMCPLPCPGSVILARAWGVRRRPGGRNLHWLCVVWFLDLAISAPGRRGRRSGLRTRRAGPALSRRSVRSEAGTGSSKCLAPAASSRLHSPCTARLQAPQTRRMAPRNQQPAARPRSRPHPSSPFPSTPRQPTSATPPRGPRPPPRAAGLPVLPAVCAPPPRGSHGWCRMPRGPYSPKPAAPEAPGTGRERGGRGAAREIRSSRPEGTSEKASLAPGRKVPKAGRVPSAGRRCYEPGPAPFGLPFPSPFSYSSCTRFLVQVSLKPT